MHRNVRHSKDEQNRPRSEQASSLLSLRQHTAAIGLLIDLPMTSIEWDCDTHRRLRWFKHH